jgi:hypothetical protein
MQTGEVGLFGKRTIIPHEATNHLNAGLLLLDLGKMTTKQILNKWNELLAFHEYGKCLWLDEFSPDADFSLVFKG